MNKSIFLCLFFLILGIGANAQVAYYGFNSLSGTYTDITGGTVHGTNANDDESFDANTIGFNFTFNGTSYSQVSINSNGFVALGTTALSSYAAISGGTSNDVISANNHDLESQTTGELRSELTGVAPNRVYVIQWKNYQHWNATDETYNFQIKLYETSNVVEIAYGSFLQGLTSRTAQVGLRGATTADFSNRTTTANWSASTAGTLNTSTCTLSATVFPATGQIYRYAPPVACVMPDNGPNTLVLSATSTGIIGSFTAQPGVDAYLIVYSTTTPLAPTPAQSTTYVAGAALGNGTVLGYTTGTVFTITGLTASTQYYIFIYSANKNCTGGPLYNVVKPLNGNITTLISDPIAFSATGVDGATVSFAATPNIANSDIMVIWNQSGTFGIPTGTYNTGDPIVGGGEVYYQGPTTGLANHTSLNPMTTYHYKAFSVSGTQYSGGIADTAKTKCGNVALPWTENFSVFPPDCWTRTAGLLAAPSTLAGVSTNWVADGFGNIGSTGAVKTNIYGTTRKDWLITPSIDLGTGTTHYQFEFDLALTTWNTTASAALTGTDDKFAVVISTDNGVTWTSANNLRLWDNAGSANVYNNISTTGEHIIINLSTYTGIVKIGFYGESTVSNADNDLFIDNVKVLEVPTCPQPQSLAVNSISDVSANLLWAAGGAETVWNIQYGASPFVLFAGTRVDGVTNPYTANGLTQNTAYQYYVQAACGGTDTSFWSGPFTFTTSCSPASVFPYTENFATYLPSTCWHETQGTLGSTTTLAGSSSTWIADGFGNVGTTGSARVNITGTTAKEWLVSPSFDLGSGTNYQLEFNLGLTASGGTGNPSTSGVDDKFAVVISTDGGNTWSSANTLRVWNNAGSPFVYNNITPAASRAVISLSGYTGVVQFGFYGESTVTNASNDLFIDSLVIKLQPSCPNPQGLNALNVTNNAADLNWVAGSAETSWNIQYGAPGFTLGAGTILYNITTRPYNLAGLTSSTAYSFYVMAKCSSSDSSAWYGPYAFTTACDPTAIPYTEDFESITVANTLPQCWSATNFTSKTKTYIAATGSYNQAAHSGTDFGSFMYGSNDYFFSKPISLVAGITYNTSVWYVTDGLAGWTIFDLKIGTAANAGAMTTTIATVSSPVNTTYQELAGTFTPTVSGMYYVGINCVATSSPWYLSFDDFGITAVTSAPICIATPVPADAAIDVNRGLTNLTWDVAAGAVGYYVAFGTSASPAIIDTVTTNSFTLPTLDSSTTYHWQVIPYNNIGVATACAIYSFTTGANFIYCESTATSTADEEILNVTFGSLNNSSTCSTTGGTGSVINQFSDYTGLPAANLTQTTSVPFSVQVGTCGGTYNNGCAIWIDYNQNGSFNDAGEKVYFSAATTSGAHIESGNIIIPATAALGTTRMRVVVTETTIPSDPCASYSWGETEDYLVKILPLVVPVANFIANDSTPIINQVVTLSDLSQNNPTTWQWYILPNNPGDFTFMNSTTATTQNPQIKFNVAGTWNVALKVTNGAGSDSLMKMGYIVATIPTNAPVAYFSATPLFTTTGNTVSLQDTSHFTPTAWQWTITPATFTYVNATSATTQNPKVQFSTAGNYTVKLVAANAAGSDTLTKTSYIQVIAAPCSSTATSTADDDIGNVTFAGINNGIATPATSNPASNNMYTNFTNLAPAQVVKGASFPISIATIYSGGFYAGAVKVYIDYNKNGTYDLPGELAFSGTSVTAGTPVTGTINIPTTADTGISIMRIVLDESDVANPCGTYSWGETEDYLINVNPQVAPVANFSANIVDPIVQQTVIFTDLSQHFPAQWQWTITPATFTFINATTAASQNPQAQFSAAGAYTVKLKVTNTAGNDSMTKVAYINVTIPTNAPIAGFSASATTANTGQTVILTDTSLYTPTTWAWLITPATFTYNNGFTVASQNPQVQFTTQGVYTVQLIATNAAGTDTALSTNYITVLPSYCNTGLGGGTCPGDITNVTITPSTLNNSTHTCATLNTSTYASYSPTGSNTGNLSIGANHTISVTTSSSDIISLWIDYNQSGTFEASEWTQVATASTIGVAATASFTVPGTATAGITGMRVRSRSTGNTNGATDPCSNFGSGITEDYLVTILPPAVPIAGFTADNHNPVLNEGVQFTDTSLNAPTSWAWSFVPNTVSYLNGTSATSQNPIVAFTNTGYYAAKLIAANMTGSDTATTDTLYIHVTLPTTPPIAYFYANDTTATTIQVVSLIDTSLQIPTAWNWSITPNTFSFVNGTSATTQNPQVLFTAAGIYSVKLIASNYVGADTATRTNYITVIEQYNMTDSVITTCSGMFYDYGGATGAYLSNMNDTLVVYPSTPGAKLSVTFSSFNLESATYDNLQIFDGNSSASTLIGNYGGTVIPPVATSTSVDGALTFVFKSDGSVTNPGWAAEFNCVLPPTPVAAFYANDTTPIVEQVVTLTDTSLNFPNTWAWTISPTTFTFVSGTTNGSQNPQVTFQNAGAYSVTLIATNATGSDTLLKTDYINVTIPTTPPTAYFWANDTTPTTAQIVTLLDTSINTPTAWQWSIAPTTFAFVNGTSAASQNPQVQFSVQGLYSVTLVASNAAGPSTLTKTDYINVVSAFNMTTDTITTCSTVLFDAGGLTGNYANNEHSILVIMPATAGNAVQLSFSAFDLQLGWDNLFVYNGSDTTGTLLGTFTGTAIPSTLFSTASNGALTLKFKSDGTTTAAGWDAYLGCVVPPAKSIAWSDTIFSEAIANDGTISTVSTLTISNEFFAPNGNLTEGVHFSSTNVPAGLTVQVTATSTSTVSVNITGTATSHASANNISNLTISFMNAAFSGNSASTISGSTKNNLEIHFYDPLVVPSIVFSEIMYDSPDAGVDSLEYFELFNSGSTNVDLSNYTFFGVTYTIPNGTILNAGAYLVVAKNSTAIMNKYGVSSLQWNAGTTNGLNNTGEMLKLKTFWGATVDSVQYSNAAPWPIANGNGNSIVLCDATLDNTLATSWLATTSTTTQIINGKQLNGSPGTDDAACVVSASIVVAKPAVLVYPNPTKETVNIEVAGESTSLQIDVFSIDGKKVVTQSYNNQIEFTGALNVSKLSPGIYTIRINTGKDIYIKKLTIQ